MQSGVKKKDRQYHPVNSQDTESVTAKFIPDGSSESEEGTPHVKCESVFLIFFKCS